MTDQLEDGLSDAVAARMVADVPVGAFLSGGIDSSTIVALMQRHASGRSAPSRSDSPIRSFDESAEAAAVAAHLGTDHTAVHVGDAEAVEVIAQSAGHLGRALRRRLPDPDLPGQPGGPPAGHRVVVGRRRRRAVRRLQPPRLARPRRGGGPRSCRPGPAGRPAPLWAASRRPLVERAARAIARLPGPLAGPKPVDQGGQAGPGPGRLGPRGRLSGPHHPLGRCDVDGARGRPAATHRATAAAHRSPTAGSPSRCSGSTWSATCPTTSSPSSTEPPWRCRSRPGSRSSTDGSSIWPGGCPCDAKLPRRSDQVAAAPGARPPRARRRWSTGRRWASACPSDRGCAASSPLGRASSRRAASARPRGCSTRAPIRRAWDLHRSGPTGPRLRAVGRAGPPVVDRPLDAVPRLAV